MAIDACWNQGYNLMGLQRRVQSAHNMRLRHIASVVALLLFATSACSSGTSPQSPPAPASSQTAREALTAAAYMLSRDAYKYRLELRGATNANNRGHVDPGKAAVSAEIDSFRQATLTLLRMQVLVDGADMWLLLTQPASSDNKWMHTAANSAAYGSMVSQLVTDPTNIDQWLSAVADVTYDNDKVTKFKGTVDLTKVPHLGHRAASTGELARAVPFTAERDADGRLSSFIVDLAAVTMEAEDALTIRYFGFGEPLVISAPAAIEVIEPPKAFIDLLP